MEINNPLRSKTNALLKKFSAARFHLERGYVVAARTSDLELHPQFGKARHSMRAAVQVDEVTRPANENQL